LIPLYPLVVDDAIPAFVSELEPVEGRNAFVDIVLRVKAKLSASFGLPERGEQSWSAQLPS